MAFRKYDVIFVALMRVLTRQSHFPVSDDDCMQLSFDFLSVVIVICCLLLSLYIADMDPTQDFNLFSKAFATENSVSFLSGLNPTPSFPSYSGPYPVGTLDCEVPTSEVLSPSPSPDPSITTVSFRIFYPCNPPQQGPKSVYWLPDPQRQYLKAYAQFLGASSDFSGYVQ